MSEVRSCSSSPPSVRRSHCRSLSLRGSRLAQARADTPTSPPPQPPEFVFNLLTVLVRGHSLSTLRLAVLCGAQSGGGAADSWHSAGSLEQKDPKHSHSLETQLTAFALVGNLKKKKKKLINANALNLGFCKTGREIPRSSVTSFRWGFLSAGCVISESIVSLPVRCDGRRLEKMSPRNKHFY